MRKSGVTLLIIFFCSGLIASLAAPFFGVGFSASQMGFMGLRALGSIASYLPRVPTPFGRVFVTSRQDGDSTYVEVFCDSCEVTNERLSRQPLIVENASIKGTFKNGRFTGTGRAGSAAVDLKTTWSNYAGQGTFSVPVTKIADLYDVVSSVVPEARKAVIQGTIQGKGTFTWPDMRVSFKPRINGFAVNGLFHPGTYAKGSFSYTFRTEPDQAGKVNAFKITTGEGTDLWCSLNDMGRYLPAAVIATEDGAFYSHPGYDLASILEAVQDNEKKKRLYRGGSTLTQQLAKNLFSGPERSYARKLRELLYAVEMEREIGKRRILELYLNVIEWGPGIFGAKAAAKQYFGKSPHELLPEEAAWLASIVRSPRTSYEREYRRGKPKRGAVERILYRMRGLSPGERSEALYRDLRFADL